MKLRVHAGEGVGEEAEAAEGGAGVTEKTAATDCNAGRNCFWCQKYAAAPFPNSWDLCTITIISSFPFQDKMCVSSQPVRNPTTGAGFRTDLEDPSRSDAGQVTRQRLDGVRARTLLVFCTR